MNNEYLKRIKFVTIFEILKIFLKYKNSDTKTKCDVENIF